MTGRGVVGSLQRRGLPYPAYLRRVAGTAALAVLVEHGALFWLSLPRLNPAGAGVVVGIAAWLAWQDVRRRGEALFEANLGAGPAWTWAAAGVGAGLAELGAWVLTARVGG